MKRKIILLLVLCISVFSAFSKTENFGTWIEVEITKKFLKDFEFSIIPELRLQDNFSADEFIFEGKLGYGPFKFLDFAAAYRLTTNVKKSGNELSQSAVFDITGKTEFDRLKGSLRARFTNDTDPGDIPWNAFYFRPRVKLAYNIKGTKLEPFVSCEFFDNLKENNFYKVRYDAGFTRKFKKKHEFGLYFRVNDYFSDRNSIYILGINYGFKF